MSAFVRASRNPGEGAGRSPTVGSMRDPASLFVLALIGALGCSAGESDGDIARDAGPDSGAVGAEAPWYQRARALDLTSDGRADTVRLVARGARPDSLSITLSLIVDGQEKHREAWGSSYELALADSAARVSPGVDTFLRAQLDSVLASVVVERLDAPGVRLMAEDRPVLERLEPKPTHRVSLAYGYETTVRLVWDASSERFVRLWSCC